MANYKIPVDWESEVCQVVGECQRFPGIKTKIIGYTHKGRGGGVQRNLTTPPGPAPAKDMASLSGVRQLGSPPFPHPTVVDEGLKPGTCFPDIKRIAKDAAG